MINISIPETFNNQPVGMIDFSHNFKRYIFNPGENWSINDEDAAFKLLATYPFVKKLGGLKNIKTYVPQQTGDPDYLKPKSIINDQQVDQIDGLPIGDFYGPGVELDN